MMDHRNAASALNEAIWSAPADVRDNLHHFVRHRQSGSGKAARPRAGTIRSSVFNLTNTILGSGTLAMPYACKLCGVGVFVALLCLTALLADYAIRVLFLAVERMGVQQPRYPSMGRAALGRPGELLSSWVVTLQQVGACIAYIVIIGDVLHPIVELTGWGSLVCARWPLQLFLIVFVIFPLCLLPSMDNLKYISVISLLLIWGTVFAVVINGALVLSDPMRRDELINVEAIHAEANTTNHSTVSVCEHHTPAPAAPAPMSLASSTAGLASADLPISGGSMRMLPEGVGQILSALPILAFAFLCHQNSFPIYKELIRPSPQRMSLVGHWSISICCFVYMMSGLTGYYTFLEHTESNLLKNFAVQGTYFSLPMDAVRTGFGASMVLSFPLMVWEARHNLDVLIFGERPYAFWRNFGLNLAIVSVTGAVGMSVSELDQVLTVVGSTCSPLMVYILPALFYLAPGWSRDGDRRGCPFGARCFGKPKQGLIAERGEASLEASLMMDPVEAISAGGELGGGAETDGGGSDGCCSCVSEHTMVMGMLWYGLMLIPCCLFVWVLQYLVCVSTPNTDAICTGFGF